MSGAQNFTIVDLQELGGGKNARNQNCESFCVYCSKLFAILKKLDILDILHFICQASGRHLWPSRKEWLQTQWAASNQSNRAELGWVTCHDVITAVGVQIGEISAEWKAQKHRKVRNCHHGRMRHIINIWISINYGYAYWIQLIIWRFDWLILHIFCNIYITDYAIAIPHIFDIIFIYIHPILHSIIYTIVFIINSYT